MITFSVNDLWYFVFTLAQYVLSGHVCDLNLLTFEGYLFHVYHGIFTNLVSHWQKCSAADGEYSEGEHITIDPLFVKGGQETDEDTAESEHEEASFGHCFSMGNVTSMKFACSKH